MQVRDEPCRSGTQQVGVNRRNDRGSKRRKASYVNVVVTPLLHHGIRQTEQTVPTWGDRRSSNETVRR